MCVVTASCSSLSPTGAQPHNDGVRRRLFCCIALPTLLFVGRTPFYSAAIQSLPHTIWKNFDSNSGPFSVSIVDGVL